MKEYNISIILSRSLRGMVSLFLYSLPIFLSAEPPILQYSNAKTSVTLDITHETFGYDDEMLDPSRLTYLQSRFYNEAGQFVSEDSFVNDTLNHYGFGGGDPGNNVDPFGTHEHLWNSNHFLHGIVQGLGLGIPGTHGELRRITVGEDMATFVGGAVLGIALGEAAATMSVFMGGFSAASALVGVAQHPDEISSASGNALGGAITGLVSGYAIGKGAEMARTRWDNPYSESVRPENKPYRKLDKKNPADMDQQLQANLVHLDPNERIEKDYPHRVNRIQDLSEQFSELEKDQQAYQATRYRRGHQIHTQLEELRLGIIADYNQLEKAPFSMKVKKNKVALYKLLTQEHELEDKVITHQQALIEHRFDSNWEDPDDDFKDPNDEKNWFKIPEARCL